MKFCVTFLVFAFAVVLHVVCTGALYQSKNVEGFQWYCNPHLAEAQRVITSEYQYSISFRLGTKELEKKDFRYCGGVRLSEQWIVTAAECLDMPRHVYLRIIYPVNDTLQTVYRHRSSLQFKIHPDYNPSTKGNNIALIKGNFFPSLNESNPALPVLPSTKDRYKTYIDNFVFVTSYDHVDRFPMAVSGERIYVITANTKAIDPSLCRKFYSSPGDKIKYICLSGHHGTDIALSQDDVGAPLLIMDSGRLKVIGIATSLGLSTQQERGPMLFTKIFPLISWIHREMHNSILS